jgi:beta-lactam-binding protein with PASTA domain
VRWTGAMIFFIGVMGLAAYWVFTQAVQGGSYVLVPDVTGLSFTRAADVLTEAGLELGKRHEVADDRVPEFHVIVQRPRANLTVRAGRKVSLTISEGKRFEPVPGFIGKTLDESLRELESTRLLAGSIARIHNNLPADTVLAQDPEPLHPVEVGGEVHLLVSDGPYAQTMIMPTLVGKSLEQAQMALSNLNVKVVPYKVERAGAEYDTVLAQYPEPGSRLNEGDMVTFDIRLQSASYLPNAKRAVDAVFVVPDMGRTVNVSIYTLLPGGGRTLEYPKAGQHYSEGSSPPQLAPGTSITVPLAYESELTVEFLVDGRLYTSYYYSRDARPIISSHMGGSGPPTLRGSGFVQQEELEPSQSNTDRANPFFPRNPR